MSATASPPRSSAQAVEHSKKGVVELKQAETYQKSARPIMCMGILMVLIIIMVIGEPEGRRVGGQGHASLHTSSAPCSHHRAKDLGDRGRRRLLTKAL